MCEGLGLDNQGSLVHLGLQALTFLAWTVAVVLLPLGVPLLCPQMVFGKTFKQPTTPHCPA
jgi:hypothetical protein